MVFKTRIKNVFSALNFTPLWDIRMPRRPRRHLAFCKWLTGRVSLFFCSWKNGRKKLNSRIYLKWSENGINKNVPTPSVILNQSWIRDKIRKRLNYFNPSLYKVISNNFPLTRGADGIFRGAEYLRSKLRFVTERYGTVICTPSTLTSYTRGRTSLRPPSGHYFKFLLKISNFSKITIFFTFS